MHDKHKGLDGVQKLLIFGGFFLFLGSLASAFGGVDLFLYMCVRYFVRLSEGNMVWGAWKEIPVPIYYKFYMFNITNADRLNLGEKPILKEMGPYTYLVKLRKKNIKINSGDGTIEYRQIKMMNFQPKMSSGLETDKVTYINLIFLGVSHVAHDISDKDAVHEKLDEMLRGAGETLTITSSVKQFLFTGVSVEAYVDMVNDPVVQSAGDFKLPEQFADGKFAVFKDKNGGDDGLWVIRSGNRQPKDLARIVTIDGKKKMSYWKHSRCNMLNGTDGTINPPFIEPNITVLQAFIPDLCRSVQWQYVNSTLYRGTFIARYKLPDFVTPAQDPDTWCFCPKDDVAQCNTTGINSLAPCYGGAPLMVSKPHFYNCDPRLVSSVVGLSPNKDQHESVLDIHAFTGITFRAVLRIQLSIELFNWSVMPTFANTSRSMVPFMWFEQSAELDWFTVMILRFLETFRRAWPTLKYIVILMTLGVIVGGLALVYKSYNSPDEEDEYPIASTNIEVLGKQYKPDFNSEYGVQ